jgi:hypothetical protein
MDVSEVRLMTGLKKQCTFYPFSQLLGGTKIGGAYRKRWTTIDYSS